MPVTIINNKIYFLFGKERNIDENPGWSDFGGGQDNNESYLNTACREGCEELTGFLGDKYEIKKLLLKYGYLKFDYKSEHGVYRCHIFPMIYDNMLVKYYNNNQKFLQKHLNKNIIKNTTIFEKTEIKWFSLKEIIKNKKSFRKFYQNVIDMILENENEIKLFVNNSLKKNNNKTRKN